MCPTHSTANKRERLLDWIRNGDPADVPVLMPGFDLPASYLKKDQSEVTWAEAIKVSQETSTHNVQCVAGPLPFDAIPFLADFSMNQQQEQLPDGTVRLTKIIKTPEGDLRSVQEIPKDKGAYQREFVVKGDTDLPAFACLIRRASDAVVSMPAIRRHIDENIKKAKDEVKGFFPSEMHILCPAFELISSNFMDQEAAVFTLYDHQDLMEELMEYNWRMKEVWLELGVQNDVDIYSYAINGMEWLSPDIYERYMIPQARRINEFAASENKLSWLHTCGKKKKLAADKVYQRMKLNVLESLSSPPTGDIDDLAQTRRDIGPDIVTRGGINVELFYDSNLEPLRKRAEYVLEATAGYKHMIGDTNSSYPAYPWENIKAVIDIVRNTGRLLD